MNRSCLAITFTILHTLLFCLPSQGGEPSGVVEDLQRSLISVMKKGEQLGYEGRYHELEPVITETHDINFVGRITISKFWKTLADEEKETFISTFKRLSVATYANRFNSYGGEAFSVVSEKPLPRGKFLVETIFSTSDGEKFHFNYVLRQNSKQWRIINIIVDGVSDLALKRSEYTSLIEREGLSSLMAKMENQIGRYANGH